MTAGWVGRIETLIRQLQGRMGGVAIAAGRVTGGGGSSYSLVAGTGVASVSGTATGVCRVVLDGSTADVSKNCWVTANVEGNGAYYCTVALVASAPITFDVYQWSAAGAAANRSFHVSCLYRPL